MNKMITLLFAGIFAANNLTAANSKFKKVSFDFPYEQTFTNPLAETHAVKPTEGLTLPEWAQQTACNAAITLLDVSYDLSVENDDTISLRRSIKIKEKFTSTSLITMQRLAHELEAKSYNPITIHPRSTITEINFSVLIEHLEIAQEILQNIEFSKQAELEAQTNTKQQKNKRGKQQKPFKSNPRTIQQPTGHTGRWY